MSKIFIYSGDDISASRSAYIVQVEKLKKDGMEVENVFAKEIDKIKLENIFGSTDLFGGSRVLVTENFFSGQKSKDKEELIKKILSFPNAVFVSFEEKEFSKTETAKLGENTVVKNFKLPNLLFEFLDKLTPGKTKENLQSLHFVLETAEAGYIFSMLIRQIRLLILASDNELNEMSPWQAGKLKKQVQPWKKDKLINLYKKLLEIDFNQKTSQSPYNLESELDLFIAEI